MRSSRSAIPTSPDSRHAREPRRDLDPGRPPPNARRERHTGARRVGRGRDGHRVAVRRRAAGGARAAGRRELRERLQRRDPRRRHGRTPRSAPPHFVGRRGAEGGPDRVARMHLRGRGRRPGAGRGDDVVARADRGGRDAGAVALQRRSEAVCGSRPRRAHGLRVLRRDGHGGKRLRPGRDRTERRLVGVGPDGPARRGDPGRQQPSRHPDRRGRGEADPRGSARRPPDAPVLPTVHRRGVRSRRVGRRDRRDRPGERVAGVVAARARRGAGCGAAAPRDRPSERTCADPGPGGDGAPADRVRRVAGARAVDRGAALVSEGDVALASAFAFVDQLAFEGVEHVCVSPGSRSTPVALAVSRHPNLRVHVLLDERASAFFALGIAKATQRPAAVVTTSGTAAAELLPAVVEASMSRTPLIVMTADRPPELRGVGANQTIDQIELFGKHVKEFLDAPVPGDDADEGGWRWRAEFLASTALRPPPGPVHVNLPFREPLVGTDATPDVDGRRVETDNVFGKLPGELGRLLREIEGVDRGIFVLGSLRRSPGEIVRLADRLAWPVLAEPTSGLRHPGTLAAGQFLISNDGFVSEREPELIVQVGAAPTSRAGLSFVTRAERLWILDPDDLVADPNGRAAGRVVVPLEEGFRAAIDRVPSRPAAAWQGSWLEADERARRAVDALVDSWDEPFEGRIARDLAALMPDGSTLVVGSSMPVRVLDTFRRPRDGRRVLANRGAGGIAGFVSTALGVSATGVSTAALCGDLTLLHDAGSLLWSAKRGLDCVFVVPNNDGGAIFSFLPQRELPEFEELFATPHRLALGAVCSAAGAGHMLVEEADCLIPAVERARAVGGVHVVEAPTERERNVELHAAVHDAVSEALRA